jgi:hypothetical protein
MADYLNQLSGFEAVMWAIGASSVGLAIYLSGCARRLDQLKALDAADDLTAAVGLTPEEIDTIRRVAERLRRGQEAASREDRPA